MTFVQRISGNLGGSLLRFAMGVHIRIHNCHLHMSVLKALQFVEVSKTWYVLDQLKMNLAGYLFIAHGFFNHFFSNGYPLSLVFICQENPRRSGILLFADHPRFCRYIGYSPEVCPRFSRNATFICDKGIGAQQLSGLVMSEIHRRRTPTSLTLKILSFHLSGMIADQHFF